MSDRLGFQTQLASIMEVLANAAVAEICKLVDDEYAVLSLEMSQCQRENKALKRKLHLLELKVARAAAGSRIREMSGSRAKVQVCAGDRLPSAGAAFKSPVTLRPRRRTAGPPTSQLNTSGHLLSASPVELVKEEEEAAMKEEMQADVSPAQDPNKDVQLISDDGVPCEAAGLGGQFDEQERGSDSCQLQSSSRRRSSRSKRGNGGSRVEVSGSSPQVKHQLLLSSAEGVDLPQEVPNPLQSAQDGHFPDFDSSSADLLVSSQLTDEVETGEGMQSCLFGMAADDPTAADANGCSVSDLPLLPRLPDHRSLTGSRRRQLYPCSFCGKAFDRPNKVKAHERVHTGEKPFECYTCGKSFSDAGNLRKHLQIHAEQKLHSCTACGKTFIRLFNLKTHQKSHHHKSSSKQ